MKEKTTEQYVYGLIDPRKPNHIKYIGKTKNVKRRFTLHLYTRNKENTYKAKWIKSLIEQSVKPEIVVIEVTDSETINERERFWIAYYRSLGQAEANHRDGGGGFTSKEAIEMARLRAVKRGDRTVDEKRKMILNFPVGSPRPTGNLKLFLHHQMYSDYGSEFISQVKEKFPHWFRGNLIDLAKNELLSLPFGSPRPHRKTKLGGTLNGLTNKTSLIYSEEFTTLIYEKFPEWFNSEKTAKNKKELLSIQEGGKKPYHNSKLGKFLSAYISKKGRQYDQNFDNAIRTKQPHWFHKYHHARS